MELPSQQSQYEPGKIFVGGLSWETNEESMRRYFEQFGTVADCVVMRDPQQPPELKKNRGFGFVKFENPVTVDDVVRCTDHTLDSKKIDPKPAVLKGVSSGIGGDHSKKAFLGGLASQTTDDDIRAYFSAFFQTRHMNVNITDIDFKIDKTTTRMRGFGFVGFDDVTARDLVVSERYHEICGKRVEAKKAEPRGATVSMGPPPMHQQVAAYSASGQYAPYAQGGATNGHHPYAAYYSSAANSQYYQAYQPHQAQQPTSYGQQYSTGAGYPYDHTSAAAAAYPRTQSSTGDRPDPQSYYQHQHNYGHGGAQQMGAGYGQDTTAAYAARTAYPTAQDAAAYSQQMASYGRAATQQQPPPQQQPRYGGGATGGYGH